MTPFQGKLRLRHLETVLAIADFGSLSKAAEQLHLTPSGLSRAITEIEELVGGRLFERTPKGMLCTALGETLCRHAQILLGDLDKAETDLAAVAEGSLGSLTVGCFSLFSGWPLADAVRQFTAQHPRVRLTLHAGMQERLIEDLDAGKIDLMIARHLPTLNPELYRCTDLMEDRVVLACAPGHPLAARAPLSALDCGPFPWIVAPAKNRVRVELEAQLRKQGLALPRFISMLSLEFSQAMIADNHHLCLLPQSVARPLARRDVLRILPVELELNTPPLAAIWRRERTSTQQIREFTAALATVIASTSGTDSND